MKKKETQKKTYNDDDGRTIARMDYDYIPWYARKPKSIRKDDNVPELSRKETFKIMMSALAAGLLIGFIFMAVYAVAILLLVLWWS